MVHRNLMRECRVSIPIESFTSLDVAIFIDKICHNTTNLHIQANDFLLSPAQLEKCIDSEAGSG